jgi:hypothetical protein
MDDTAAPEMDDVAVATLEKSQHPPIRRQICTVWKIHKFSEFAADDLR